jgi:hypothetical protein
MSGDLDDMLRYVIVGMRTAARRKAAIALGDKAVLVIVGVNKSVRRRPM